MAPAVRTDTTTQPQRRQAAAEAVAIARIAGGEITPEMAALNERWIARELTTDEVIAELARLHG
jgi:hypothetical protein